MRNCPRGRLWKLSIGIEVVAQLTQLDWNLRYLPRNDSGNDSKLERRVIDEAEVRSRRHDHCCCLEMMLVAQLRAGVDGMVLWRYEHQLYHFEGITGVSALIFRQQERVQDGIQCVIGHKTNNLFPTRALAPSTRVYTCPNH